MKAFQKDIFRTIKCSLGRFLAIFLIVGLGSGFYAALRMICPDMKIAADDYYDSTNLTDVRIVSTLGLVEEDLSAVEALEGVEKAALAYETDIIGELHGEQVTMRLHSMTNDAGVNNIELVEGRLPNQAGECVISNDCVINPEKNIGDKISVKECANDVDSTLSTTEFTIVGKVESPLYVDFASPGNTTLGSGQLDEYAYVADESFAEAYPYNEIFLTVKGARDKFAYSDDYTKTIKAVISDIEAIAPEREQARLDSIKGEAQDKLDKSQEEYKQKEAQAYSELNSAQSTLDSSKKELDSARTTLDKTPVELLSAHEQLSDATTKLEAAKTTLNFLNSQKSTFEMTRSMAKQALSAVPKDSEEYSSIKQQYDELENQANQIEEGISQAEAAVTQGERQLAIAQAQYSAAKSQYYSGVDSYYSGVDAYNEGAQELQTNRDEAEKQLAEARKKLSDAQDQINNLKTPEWLIMDRSKIQSVESYKTDAERVESIAKLFPLIFFLVAALVALTTMTRMIEEERLSIGTYKALGYSVLKIASKFLIYASIASAAGAIVGILLLSEILPTVIMNAYATMYRMPHSVLMPIDLPLALLSFVAGVGITLLVTLAATLSTLREAPASLLRPKVGKAGSKILLERVKFLWKRLSFSGKVTLRNLFRYKKRSLMTIIGIAGCTGLLLTGFGLNDALNDMIDNQYGRIISYNATVSVADSPTDSASEKLSTLMNDNDYVDSSANVQSNLIIANTGAGKDVHASLIITKDFSNLNSVWKIKERGKSEDLQLSDSGVLICEKLANLFNVGVGDEITLCQQDDLGNASNKRITAKVSGIFENYLFNYVIATPEVYSELFDGKEPAYSTYYAKISDNKISRDEFKETVNATGAVKSVSFNSETIETYRQSLSAVNMVIVVLVACAALLAFIVLYNLNNINICERKREIATLKVLGFTEREVVMYIYRETIILTILGCLVGIAFGLLLETFVVTSAEGNLMMFGRDIHAISFALASVITVAFSLLVMFIMRRKFSKVDMVESLKSAE